MKNKEFGTFEEEIAKIHMRNIKKKLFELAIIVLILSVLMVVIFFK